jgi:hypothetical protein
LQNVTRLSGRNPRHLKMLYHPKTKGYLQLKTAGNLNEVIRQNIQKIYQGFGRKCTFESYYFDYLDVN